jgi:DNA processing protein
MDMLIYWLALKAVRGVGNHLFLRLLQRFGTPYDVFHASKSQLQEVEGVNARVAARIVQSGIPEGVQEDLDRVYENGYRIVTFSEPPYPALLREIHDPPPFLYVHGTLRSKSSNISIVGSRNATSYGRDVTRRLSADLAARGLTVVSGMARGIDSAAHAGALSAGGQTIAVLGCGLGTIYPAENRELFHRIADNGAVISEFPFLAKPEAHHFPIRNRIISGLSLGTVIIEATPKSGSLITATLAAEQGREVFAVPGSVTSFKSMGTHGLIKQGAKLVEHVQDILEELPLDMPASAAVPSLQQVSEVTIAEKKVLDQLTAYPTHIDNLVRRLSMCAGEVSSLLLQLEVKGLASQQPGNRFVRSPQADSLDADSMHASLPSP